MIAHRLLPRLVVVSAAALVTAVACSRGGSTQTVKPRGGPSVTHQVSENDRGTTLQAKLGDRVVVTLHNTYWQLDNLVGPVLVAAGRPEPVAGGPSCSSIPGTGCGTIRAEYFVAA